MIVEIALDPDCVKRTDPKTKVNDNNGNKRKNKNSKIPETYYIVTDNRYIKQRGLIVWSKTAQTEKHETKLGMWAILMYVVIILSVILYRADWNKMYRKLNRLKFKFGRV